MDIERHSRTRSPAAAIGRCLREWLQVVMVAGPALLAACANSADAALAVSAEPWFEVLAHEPGPEVTDPVMRAKLIHSGRPWKVRDRATGIAMVLVMPGEFSLGSPSTEEGRKNDEGPQRRVRLTRPFYLGATEVSQSQWDGLMGTTRSFFPGPDNPADPALERIWEFLAVADARTAIGTAPLRLPTEAEWEYACRAGTTGRFHFDEPIRHDQVNHNDGVVRNAVVVEGRLEVDWITPPSEECPMQTVPVGSLPPNAWGLHEMHGNLWEWTSDRYTETRFDETDTVVIDPVFPAGPEELRTLRGGSWYDAPKYCRSAARDRGHPGTASNRIGFRVARSL